MNKVAQNTIRRINPPKFSRKDFDRKEFLKLATKVSKILRDEAKEREEGYGRFGVSY